AGESEVNTASNSSDRSQSSTQTAQATPEIRKAIPVAPQEKTPVEIRRAVPVKPLDQEDENQTLLRSAARPPGNPDEWAADTAQSITDDIATRGAFSVNRSQSRRPRSGTAISNCPCSK